MFLPLPYHRDNRGMFRNACIQRPYHLVVPVAQDPFRRQHGSNGLEQLIIVLSEDWVSDSRLPKSINFQIAKDFIVRFNLVTIQALLCPVTQHGRI